MNGSSPPVGDGKRRTTAGQEEGQGRYAPMTRPDGVRGDQGEGASGTSPRATNVTWHAGAISRGDRAARLGHASATLWFTGLSGSGKSTVAVEVERLLHERGVLAYRLDGDNLRHGLCRDLGFSAEERRENVRRAGEAARLVADAGVVCLASFISPARAERALVSEIHAAAGIPFFEIFVDVPLEVAEARDPKGLYRKARAGEIRSFTGIDDPYEAPLSPALHLRTDRTDVRTSAGSVALLLERSGIIRGNGTSPRSHPATL